MSTQINLSGEQSMLLETAVSFCESQAPIAKVREAIEHRSSFDRDQWQAMVDLGWSAIAIPETYGGLGMGLGSVVPVIESMGRQLMASPMLNTTVAAMALDAAGNEQQKGHWLPKLATGSIATFALTEEDGSWDLRDVQASATAEGDSLVLSGTKTFVLDADAADVILTSVRYEGAAHLVLIEDIDPTRIQDEIVIDETRRSFQLDLQGLVIDQSQLLPSDCFDLVERAMLLLISADMAGGMQSVLSLVVEYLNTRKAFERYIGSYQALKHPAVDILLAMEAARSHVYHAATLWDEGADEKDLEIAVRMTKAHTSETYAYAGDRAVQFHGAMGFTFECDAQLHLRRALWGQYQFGDERFHRMKLAPLVFDAA
jgi:acyl-CoA dehydrogenase